MTSVWQRKSEASRKQLVDEFLDLSFTDITRTDGPRTVLQGTLTFPSEAEPEERLDVIVEISTDHPYLPPIVRYLEPPEQFGMPP